MRRLLFSLLTITLFAVPSFAREKLQGYCQQGGVAVTVPGTQGSGTQRFQQSFRSCTVTVYQAGTLTSATIYSDNSGTIKPNPFTADTTGLWFFYADNGNYDVRFSGGGIGAPFTLGDFPLGGTTIDCSNYTGITYGAKVAACIADLPTAGGDVDARNLLGSQTVSVDMWSGVVKPGRLFVGATTINSNITQNIPSNWSIMMSPQTVWHHTSTTTPAFSMASSGNVSNIQFLCNGGVIESTNLTATGTLTGQFGLIDTSGVNTTTDLLIDKCVVRYGYNALISIGNTTNVNSRIMNSRLYTAANYCVGFTSDTLIVNNVIHDCQYSALDGGAVNGGVNISDNELYNYGGGSADTDGWAGVLINGGPPSPGNIKGISVIGNYIHNEGKNSQGQGIYVAVGAGAIDESYIPIKVLIANNTVESHNQNPWSTRLPPCGICVSASRSTEVIGNISRNNYWNYVVFPNENTTGSIVSFPVRGLNMTGNQSIDATNTGFKFYLANLGYTGDVTSNTFFGNLLQNNVSWNDAADYSLPTYNNIFRHGNVTIPGTETLGSELVSNPGFETGCGAAPTNWSAINAGAIACSVDAHSGSWAGQATRGASNEAAESATFALIAGQLYKVSAWIKTGTATNGQIKIYTNGGALELAVMQNTTTSYAQRIGYMVAQTTGNYTMRLLASTTAAGTALFDDVSVKAVTNMPSEGAATSGPLTVTGAMTASGALAGSNFLSGTYSPSFTLTANVSAAMAGTFTNYVRMANVVTVFGEVATTSVSTNGTVAQLDMTVPISSTFTDQSDLAGITAGFLNAGPSLIESGSIQASGTKARIVFFPTGTTATTRRFYFSYTVK